MGDVKNVIGFQTGNGRLLNNALCDIAAIQGNGNIDIRNIQVTYKPADSTLCVADELVIKFDVKKRFSLFRK